MSRLYQSCSCDYNYIHQTGGIASVDCEAPLNFVNREYIRLGLLTNESNTELLNLYGVCIMRSQGIWKYYVEDKYNFQIPLFSSYLENGDKISDITGKNGVWKVVFDNPYSKYVRF